MLNFIILVLDTGTELWDDHFRGINDMFLEKEEVKVTEQSPMLSRIEYSDGKTCWVKTERLTENPVTVKKGGVYKPVIASELSSVFLGTLAAVREQVSIRVHYPKHAEGQIQETFSKAGVALPEDIRALNSGSRGGQTVQRDWAAVVWFPETPSAPEGSKADSNRIGFMMNSRRDVVLGILKAGFEITDYTKEENRP